MQKFYDEESNKNIIQKYCIIKVQKKLIQKGESDGIFASMWQCTV